MDKADAALYQYKNGGRNRTTAWRKPPPLQAPERPASAA